MGARAHPRLLVGVLRRQPDQRPAVRRRVEIDRRAFSESRLDRFAGFASVAADDDFRRRTRSRSEM